MQYKKITAAILCAATFPTFAAEILPDVVVTATRTEQAADKTLASSTVITRADIDRLQAQSLTDVLRGVAGLTLSNNGGAGKASSVFMRGTNADHILVLVDGIKIGSATTGTASFQDIPVAQIERIEIVRGPRASLYGSEAIGGVIQIFTRKKGNSSASFTAGSYGTYNTTAGISAGDANGWVNLQAQQQNVRGFNACRGSLVAGCFVNQPDKDGYHNSSLGLNAGYVADNGIRSEVNALQAVSKNQYDGSAFSGNQAEGLQQVVGGNVKFSPTQNWLTTLRLGSAQDNSNAFFNGTFVSRYNTQRDNLSVQNDFALRDNQLVTIGFDQQKDTVNSTTAYAKTTRNNDAFFTQYQGSVGAHSVQLSARRDNNQQYGGHSTSGVGYGYALNDDTRLTASVGTAFKAPTFNQLYFPGFGSATLRPELSRSTEVGIAQHTDLGKWSLNAYETKVTDLIGFDARFNPVNINTATLRGLEAQALTQIADWDITTTLTSQDPRQTSGVNSGKLLNRRATKTARIELAHQFAELRVASSLYGEGRRYDDLANTAGKKLGGYSLLDLRAEYRIAPEWRVQGRVDNLTDKQYETAQFFNQARRGLYLTLSYQAK
ncbi:MAG: TonB-dependent vitamin B12 receptor [Sideroxydans sp.]|nr:TonB-dependent vitamin B12 receptor [Sideroxydans sp.]